jgi:hypothetical protein
MPNAEVSDGEVSSQSPIGTFLAAYGGQEVAKDWGELTGLLHRAIHNVPTSLDRFCGHRVNFFLGRGVVPSFGLFDVVE